MNVLSSRLAIMLAATLLAAPAFAATDSEAEQKPASEATAPKAETPTDEPKASDDEGINEAQKKLAEEDAEWAEKIRKRTHEGDVALGVCGGRLTALMWFYQASVVDGRDDLEPAYESLKESREVLKKEAERRAIEDGIGTSVSVMNEHSTELWDKLVDASEKPETFQETHDLLFADVQECLSLFFDKRQTAASTEAPAGEVTESEADDDSKAAD